MSKMIVLDTNILVFASPQKNDHNPKASALIWEMLSICHSICIDSEYKIMDREYKKHMKNDITLTSWLKYMRLRDKIKYRTGEGEIKGLKEMDCIFACVATRTPDRAFITENGRCFNHNVKNELKKHGVNVMNLEEGYEYIHS